MTIIIFLIVLAVLIFVHEAGHFLAAKWSGISVHEFGFGFPPRLVSFTRGETTYSLNVIPFGGFVKIENEEELRNVWVLGAGVIGNVALAVVLFSLAHLVPIPTRVIVTEVIPHSPAETAGIRVGDEVLGFAPTDARTVINLSRTGKSFALALTPVTGLVEGKTAIGVGMSELRTQTLPLPLALLEGVRETGVAIASTIGAYRDLAVGLVRGGAKPGDIAGPVGLATLVGQAAGFGFGYLAGFVALISVNLAVVNLIPIPALDGGRLLVVLVEALIRRPLPKRHLVRATQVSFALLLILMLVVTWHDIARLGMG